MPRFKSATSGVTVSVSDETAELLGSEWEPVDAPKTSRTSKKSD
jgi:hypothetical protein